eukprot:1792824-Rhodomonas_salina.1
MSVPFEDFGAQDKWSNLLVKLPPSSPGTLRSASAFGAAGLHEYALLLGQKMRSSAPEKNPIE